MALELPPSEVCIYAQPTGLFKDEDFLQAAKQVQNPQLEGWELFVESMGVKIYKRYIEVNHNL